MMNRRFSSIRFSRIRSLGCLLALALLGGCASSRTTTTGAPVPTAPVSTHGQEVLRRLAASYETTPALSINGTMRASGQPVTVWIDAIIRRRDSLKIVMTGPFGIPVGAMSAAPGGFLFFNAQEGEAVEGLPDRRTFEKLLTVGLDYQEMVALLRGELPRMPSQDSVTSVEADGVISYRVEAGGIREEFTIDPDDLTVRSYTRSAIYPDTTIQELTISYDNFARLGGRSFPRKGVVDVRGGLQRISVMIEKLASEIPSDESFSIDVPAGIPRKKL